MTDLVFHIRLGPDDQDRLDRLVEATRQRQGSSIPRVTRSSALRQLLVDWDLDQARLDAGLAPRWTVPRGES